MTTETIARDVAHDVREACERSGRTTTLGEVERALGLLDAGELDIVRRVARSTVSRQPLGPDAILDIARGTPSEMAAARELSGYYALAHERDALAAIARPSNTTRAAAKSDSDSDADDERPAPPDALEGERVKLRKPVNPKLKTPEADALLTLFAYHRDAVRVAQELAIGLTELNERIESFGLRRKINRLLETTTDIELFTPERIKPVGKASAQEAPLVRKRGEKSAVAPQQTEPAPAPSQPGKALPAARTEPVNAHGTRVYRRTETRGEVPPSDTSTTGRREYVRETRRKAKPAAEKKAETKSAPPAISTKHPFYDLQSHGGRAILERAIADEKANPRVFTASLAQRYDGPGRELAESDLRQLLTHHGLAETFQEREVVNARFLIGFHQGARGKLCNALLMTPQELGGYLTRLGLSEEFERTREERARTELGRRKMADRIAQVLTRAPYLEDIGVLEVIDREVRTEVESTLSRQTDPEAAREALGVDPKAFQKLLKRYGLAATAA